MWRDSSLYTLLGANIVVAGWALYEGWDVGVLMWVYWCQSVIIGLFNFWRILSLEQFSTENFKFNNQSVLPTKSTKYKTAFFFLMHYGFFHIGYVAFLFTYFGFSVFNSFTYIMISSGVFLINHFFSFLHNRARDKQVVQNIGTLMGAPYMKIIPMHLTFFLGANAGQSALPIFLFLKIGMDALSHSWKHKGLKMKGINS